MTFIGLDQSINSTGICIDNDSQYSYHLIVPHITKKQDIVNKANNCVLIHSYEKDTLDINLKEICSIIEDILLKTPCNCVCFEAISFASNGRVVDLAQLAGYIRAICDKLNIKYVTSPPTSIKKFATGNGQADKELMTYSWSLLDPETYNLTKDIKQDDLADSYFMSQYAKSVFESKSKSNQDIPYFNS